MTTQYIYYIFYFKLDDPIRRKYLKITKKKICKKIEVSSYINISRSTSTFIYGSKLDII